MTMTNCKPSMVVPDQVYPVGLYYIFIIQSYKPKGKNTNDLECHPSQEYYFIAKRESLPFFLLIASYSHSIQVIIK